MITFVKCNLRGIIMENIEKRLVQLIATLGFNNARFADAIDVQRSSISHILSGRNKPSFDFLRKIFLKFPNINADWLIMGRGEMFEQEITPVVPDNVDISQRDLSNSNKLFTEKQQNVTDVPEKPLKKPEKHIMDVEKVIILHTDGTFSEFKKRKA